MANERVYPDEPAGPFPSPPKTLTDRQDRDIEIRTYDDTEQEREALVEMYVAFDPADRAQGIPPTGESQIRSWLDEILDASLNVIAWHEDTAAGHATLVPHGNASELAIFVLQEYQEAGIGTRLMKVLLGYGADNGLKRVWLTVERWNEPAVNLYRKIGFESSDAEGFELEMSLRLGSDDQS
jgi:GNAT superfamily N-acetyltransferase